LLVAVFIFGNLPLRGADRCADARDDIRRARAVAEAGQDTQARSLLRSALFACPANPQNLNLLAEAYDALGELAQAGTYRERAMRLAGISAKPTVSFTSPQTSIERGQTTTLSWDCSYATAVEINPELGRVPAKGTKTVAPSSTATYQLTARGPGGAATAALEIIVTLPRLTVDNIVDLLRNEVPKPRIAKLVAERGISFDLTLEVEEKLRSAGADDAVIDAVRSGRH